MVYELLHRSCLRGPEVIHYQDQCQQIKKMGKNLSSLWDVGEYQFVRLPPARYHNIDLGRIHGVAQPGY